MKHKSEETTMRKSPWLYIIMIATWLVLAVFLWLNFIPSIRRIPFIEGKDISAFDQVAGRILLLLNAVFISYFWLNGVKDFLYVIWYYCFRRRMFARYHSIIQTDVSKATYKVLMVYCTCNDFDGESLIQSMAQTYRNVDTVILDDSSTERYKKLIDKFAEDFHVKVVRRENRIGFKAGNINHYLQSEECKALGYDYYVILDSDEILPSDFVYECLKYFYAQENIGIVQANHISDRNRNFFMKLFHIGVNSHWPTYQTMKHFYGFSTMLGHGAMIKRDCYEKAGGFPPLVAEDLCLSIEARAHGYFVAFAPNIVCREEYPIDYVAFKKRHSKWTQGNLEFIKRYTGKIARSNMKWYEKMDIVLFTYNLPLTAIFAFFIFSNLMIAPLLHIQLGAVYSTWLIVPTVIFFCSPMLNDFITWSLKLNPLRTILYTVCVIMLYGSMLTTSLVSALLGMFGKKAKFIVTPKSSQKIGLGFALKFQWKEIAFSTLLLALSLCFQRTVAPVFLIIFTGYSSVMLLFFSNRKYTAGQTERIDAQTSKISLAQNRLYEYNREVEQKRKIELADCVSSRIMQDETQKVS